MRQSMVKYQWQNLSVEYVAVHSFFQFDYVFEVFQNEILEKIIPPFSLEIEYYFFLWSQFNFYVRKIFICNKVIDIGT